MAHPSRCSLPLNREELIALRTAVDASLSVPPAMSASARGREEGLARLGGTLIAHDAARNSIVKQRVMDASLWPIKKKRRSGRSNWPSTPEGRMALRLHLAERKALGLPSGVGRRPSKSNGAHAPTEPWLAMLRLKRAVAAATNVDPAALSSPRATISMIAPQGRVRLPAAQHARRCIRVDVALRDCRALQLEPPSARKASSTMRAGAALVLDARERPFLPQGDWRRTIQFDVVSPNGSAMSDEGPPSIAAPAEPGDAGAFSPSMQPFSAPPSGGCSGGEAGASSGSCNRLPSAIAKQPMSPGGEKKGKQVTFSDVERQVPIMMELGVKDEDTARRALVQARGDIDAAVAYYLMQCDA